MLNMLWRDKFVKELALMKPQGIRVATQILTGHAALKYHLSKLNRTIQPLSSVQGRRINSQVPTSWDNARTG